MTAASQSAMYFSRRRSKSRRYVGALSPWSPGLNITAGMAVQSFGLGYVAANSGVTGAGPAQSGNGQSNDGAITWNYQFLVLVPAIHTLTTEKTQWQSSLKRPRAEKSPTGMIKCKAPTRPAPPTPYRTCERQRRKVRRKRRLTQCESDKSGRVRTVGPCREPGASVDDPIRDRLFSRTVTDAKPAATNRFAVPADCATSDATSRRPSGDEASAADFSTIGRPSLPAGYGKSERRVRRRQRKCREKRDKLPAGSPVAPERGELPKKALSATIIGGCRSRVVEEARAVVTCRVHPGPNQKERTMAMSRFESHLVADMNAAVAALTQTTARPKPPRSRCRIPYKHCRRQRPLRQLHPNNAGRDHGRF